MFLFHSLSLLSLPPSILICLYVFVPLSFSIPPSLSPFFSLYLPTHLVLKNIKKIKKSEKDPNSLKSFFLIFLNHKIGPNVGLGFTLGSSLTFETDKLQQKIFGRDGGTADIELGGDQLISERSVLCCVVLYYFVCYMFFQIIFLFYFILFYLFILFNFILIFFSDIFVLFGAGILVINWN